MSTEIIITICCAVCAIIAGVYAAVAWRASKILLKQVKARLSVNMRSYMAVQTVPIMVDDRKDIGEFKMTRVSYYYIEAIEPSPDIPIDQGGLGIPVLPLEFSGAIHKPANTKEYFETPNQIEDLFHKVERYESLYVDADNIWIPNHFFNKTPERGEVYRVPFNLFIKLYSLCRDDAFLGTGISRISDNHDLVLFSEVETIAFANWTRETVKSAIETFPKNENLMLDWKESDGRS